MGKKVNPLALRPNFVKCQWFTSNKREFAKKVLEDCQIRQLAKEVIGERLFADLSLERIGNQTNITINTHKPGIIVGAKEGKVSFIEKYKKQLEKKIFNGKSFQVLISEILKPELNPIIVANNVAEQLELRMNTKSCMKKAISYFIRNCPQGGIRIICSGRVGGAEIARREKIQEGKMPLSSIKASVSMAIGVAHTVYGTVSVKVYVYIPKDFQEFKRTFYGDRNGDRKDLNKKRKPFTPHASHTPQSNLNKDNNKNTENKVENKGEN